MICREVETLALIEKLRLEGLLLAIASDEQISADRVEDIAQAEGARVDVRGYSSDLYLWLWDRDSRAVLDGSPAVADPWTTTVRVRWS